MAENKNKNIFRQKSLDKISSPDQLDKYIKIAKPSLVLLFISIALFLAGLITWTLIGTVETKAEVGFKVSSGVATTWLKTEDYDNHFKDMKFEAIKAQGYISYGEEKYTFESVSEPTELKERTDENYILFNTIDLKVNDWYYEITFNANLDDGSYKAYFVYEEVTPIQFIF